jgi:IS30 family transposase
MIGKGHCGALVTVVERATKFTVSKQVEGKMAATVTKATIALLESMQDVVLMITADNGKEFAYHKGISEALDADVYFARRSAPHPSVCHEKTAAMCRFARLKPAPRVLNQQPHQKNAKKKAP